MKCGQAKRVAGVHIKCKLDNHPGRAWAKRGRTRANIDRRHTRPLKAALNCRLLQMPTSAGARGERKCQNGLKLSWFPRQTSQLLANGPKPPKTLGRRRYGSQINLSCLFTIRHIQLDAEALLFRGSDKLKFSRWSPGGVSTLGMTTAQLGSYQNPEKWLILVLEPRNYVVVSWGNDIQTKMELCQHLVAACCHRTMLKLAEEFHFNQTGFLVSRNWVEVSWGISTEVVLCHHFVRS